MTNETAQPTNVGSNDLLGLAPERAAFERWAAQRWGAEAYRHTSATSGEWDAWQGRGAGPRPESAWLVEWKAHGYGPQWWGFSYEPGKHGDWCADSLKAVRFARKEDAERMRLHIIAVAGLTGHHAYEQRITATEHEWPNDTSRSQRMREAGFTRRPTWRSLPSDE